MRSITFGITICFCVLFLTITYSQLSSGELIDSLVTELKKAKHDTTRIFFLTKISFEYVAHDQKISKAYADSALVIANRINWKKGIALSKEAIGRIHWRLGDFPKALKYHGEALDIYRELGIKEKEAIVLLFIGQDYANSGDYPLALEYFEKSLNKYKPIGRKDNQAVLHSLMSWVYSNMGMKPEELHHQYESLKLSEELGDRWSTAIAHSNIAGFMFDQGKLEEAVLSYKDVIKIFLELQDYVNYGVTNLLLGNCYFLLDNDSLALLHYKTAIITGQKLNDHNMLGSAYNNMTNLFINNHNYSEALKYADLAQNFYSIANNKSSLADIYSKTAICYSNLGNFKTSKIFFEKALVLLQDLESIKERNVYYQRIVTLDSATNNWKDAFDHYRMFVLTRDSMYNEENTKKLVQTKMQYDFDKKEAATKAEQDKKDIRQKTIRNSIAGVLLGSLIFLVVVYRQRNKINKARKRSDELLLNILPEEVAEELKAKGRTEAKHFDEVTVMFTDFKGFTQIAENLSATELVTEIDTCFKAFDEIIGRYGIEKIKTIGDAYMCAGGLPVANKSHAEDVVKAALDIQRFMSLHLQQRKREGKEIFEIRIGIHSGPVVAGIVGVKKFAYDIWGDTVNIASRMESSGEAGKVNISSSTYKLVKNKFKCEHRGKIQAKNKGEIDMYFLVD